MAKAKKQEVESIFDRLEKHFGKGTFMTADTDEKLTEVKESTSTGSLTLDLALGVGGIPKGGLVTHVVGMWSTGKTTLALSVIANEHKKNPESVCCFLDLEGTLDGRYATMLGVDLKRLHVVKGQQLLKNLEVKDRKQVSGEEWLQLVVDLLNMDIYEFIVLDSVAALTPLSEIEGGLSASSQMARVGAMLSKAFRSITAALINSKCGLIMLNQFRLSPGAYGDPRQPVGGEAFKFFQAVKIELYSTLDKDDKKDVHGITVKGKIDKSKVSIPQKKFEYYIRYGEGIIRSKEVFDLSVGFGFINKKGGWYYLDEETKIQGEDNMLAFLEDNEEWYQMLEEKVLDRIKNPTQDVEQTEEELDNPGDTAEEIGIQEEG